MNVKRRLRGPGVALLVAIAGSLVASAPAGAAADFTWSGGGSTANWSDAGNWRGGSAPAGSVGTLAFPAVGSCPSCYGVPSDNDITGLSANSLSIDDSFSYGMFGSALTLGAGGITAAPTSHSGKDTTIGNDIILGWPQTWAIAGDGQDSQAALTFTGTITGGADLTVDLSNDARMSVRDVETGTITINGAGVLTLGTSINGTSTDPVIVEGGASLRVGGAASIGPLRLIGGGLALRAGSGTPPISAGTLTVRGSVSLDAATSVSMEVGDSTSPVWGAHDQPQINASGPVDLNSAHLTLVPVEGCPVFVPGKTYTLVTTTGPLTGEFAGIPDGTVVTLGSRCPGASQTLRIAYGAHTALATVIDPGPSPTSTGVSSSPQVVVTNQPATLTATVTADYGTPRGTVNISDVANSHNIPDCARREVVAVSSSGTASCRTSFAAAGAYGSEHDLFASYTPSDAATRPSDNTYHTLIFGRIDVHPATTATAVRASRPSTPTGGKVTYTATVTPAYLGPVVPSGSLEFDDHGVPIGSCRSRPLTRSDGTATARCTVTYAAVRAHAVTARYAGDANFVGSTSRATTVTSWSVQALRTQLQPSSPRTAIATLLRHGKLVERIAVGMAGTLTIRWYVTTSRGKHVLLASGHATYASSGKMTIELTLTPAGRTVISQARRIRVTASAVFVPRNAPPVAITRTFLLR